IKEASHPCRVYHCMDAQRLVVSQQAVQPAELGRQKRIRLLIQLLSGMHELSWFHPDMLALEPRVAEQKHQQRACAEFLAMWRRVFDACTDLPQQPADSLVEALHLAVWGGRRYAMQLRLDEMQMRTWAGEMEAICIARLAQEQANQNSNCC